MDPAKLNKKKRPSEDRLFFVSFLGSVSCISWRKLLKTVHEIHERKQSTKEEPDNFSDSLF
jgi:hypothetical protein